VRGEAQESLHSENMAGRADVGGVGCLQRRAQTEGLREPPRRAWAVGEVDSGGRSAEGEAVEATADDAAERHGRLQATGDQRVRQGSRSRRQDG
jgi:hypothetical protein